MLSTPKELVPTYWQFDNWLAGKALEAKDKPVKKLSLASLHGESKVVKKAVWNKALCVHGVSELHVIKGYDELPENKKDDIALWVTGVCNSFLRPIEMAAKQMNGSGVTLSYSSTETPLGGIKLKMTNTVSPLNRDGENADGDKDAVILELNASSATKARNYLLRALEAVEKHILSHS